MKDDTINRQAAIDVVHKAVLEMFDYCDDDIEEPMTYTEEKMLEVNKLITDKIRDLPSAQPKIIRCKDCKYAEEADEREWLLCHWYGDQWNEEDHWCSHAERNVDE